MSSEPPEEPHRRAQHNPLSPASPKPIHFPTPTNIAVLDMQMDVGFNQTEAHMSDAAMHNTEVRPDMWRDPNEQAQTTEAIDHASPYSVGGEAMESTEQNGGGQQAIAQAEEQNTDSNETASANTAAVEAEPEPVPFPTTVLDNANGTNAESSAQPNETIQASSDPSVPTAEASSVQQPSQDAFQDVSNQNEQAQPSGASQAFSGNPVDVQSLLDTLQTAPSAAPNTAANTAPQAEGMTIATTISPSSHAHTQPNAASSTPQQSLPPGVESSPLSASGLGIPPSGLPPRPPPQEQPLIHPNYVHSQHIRDYHPHATHPAFQPHARSASGTQGNAADPSSRNYVPPVHSPSGGLPATLPSQPGASGTVAGAGSSYGGAPGTSTGASGSYGSTTTSPTTYMPNGGQQSGTAQAGSPQAGPNAVYPAYAGSPQQQQLPSAGAGWGVPNNMYNPASQYPGMASSPIESKAGGQGNLRPEDRPWDAEVQRKYDRFIEDERRYVSEGRWEQFPQGSRLFVGNLSSEKVTKRDIFHVFHTYGELAQISIKQAYGFVQFLRTEDCVVALEKEQGTLIRDKRIHLEVSKPQKNRNQNQQRRSRSPPGGRQGSNTDRYTSGARGGNNRGNTRDGYRPGYRSPSPRGYRDRYDDRYRQRSRSPPGYGRGRYRSPSPKREIDDDLPLPKRDRRDVPDVQIIVLDSLDRDFISWVESAFSSRSVRVDVLLLSPRLSEQAVVRRQIMEGVVAVVKLKRDNQMSGKVGLQIFDRRQGVGNVTFEEYDGLDPPIAVELVLRAKLTHGAPNQPPPPQQAYGGGYQQQYPPPPVQQQYGAPAPSYGAPQPSYGQPQPSYAPPANYAQPPGVHAQPPNLQSLITNLDPNNLQSLIANMGTPQSGNTTANPYGATPMNSAVQQPGYWQGQQQPQGGAAPAAGGQVNMQDILARLGSYQR